MCVKLALVVKLSNKLCIYYSWHFASQQHNSAYCLQIGALKLSPVATPDWMAKLTDGWIQAALHSLAGASKQKLNMHWSDAVHGIYNTSTV